MTLAPKSRNSLFILTLAIGTALVGCNNAGDDTRMDDTTPADTTAAGDEAMPPAYDDSATAGVDATADADFFRNAMDGNQKEVALGNLAQEQAQDQAVKDYAAMMVADHTAMNQQVAAAAGMADAAMPAADASATADLEGKTGADFDRAYIDMMVADHEKTVAMFEDAAQNAATEEARTLAASALPKLREHLQRARELQQQPGT
jgi:putative membrane protein